MAESWSGSPSPGKTLHKNYLQKTKKSSFPSRGTRTGNTKSCGTTLFAAHCGHFQNGANTPSALNAGNTSADTLDRSISPCPRRPICCSAFRSDLSFRNSLWMRYAALLPRLWFGVSSVAFIKHYICPFVKHFFLPGADSLANFPPACYDKENYKLQFVVLVRQRPCLPLWGRWLSIAKPERAFLCRSEERRVGKEC